MKNLNKKIFILLVAITSLFPAVSFSADIFFDTQKSNFGINEEFLVKVFVDTENVSVNAIEGEVLFPVDILELKEVRDGNSSINFWIEKPKITSGESVVFSGITAGGFSGGDKYIFSLVFKSKKIGKGTVDLKDIQVLINDGNGTKIDTKITPLVFSVSEKPSSSSGDLVVDDTYPPENFLPNISNDPSILDGYYFVVFSTQDKGSGVSYYEVKEGFWGDYKKAESPYLLEDQSLTKKVYVKAVDKNGNERVVELSPVNRTKWYQDYVFISIIILLGLILFFQKKWLKNSR